MWDEHTPLPWQHDPGVNDCGDCQVNAIKKLNVAVNPPLLSLTLIIRSDRAAINLSSFCGSPQTAFLAAVPDF